MSKKKHISIPLAHIAKDLALRIYPEGKSKVFKIEESEALEFGEFPYQILESQNYEYAFNKKGYRLSCDYSGIVKQSHREKFAGKINPSYYVGTLKLNISHKKKELINQHTYLEVKATKFNSDNIDKSYRENYRYMLEDITKKCTELLLQVNAPIQQHFETDFDKSSKSLYQQFSFVNAVIGSIEFKEAIQKIISTPKTEWTANEASTAIRSVKKFTRKTVKQLISGGNRIPIPQSHPLYQRPLSNIPSHIINNKKVEIIDNAENRFIKHALQTYLHFSESCLNKFKEGTRAHKEAQFLSSKLELNLNNSFFKQISRPTSLNFNSPVLQRKSGYREILKSWLKFDLAAKLTWRGGEDVYQAGKRDISKLYEYWVFFMLYDLFKSKFPLEKIAHNGVRYPSLIKKEDNGLNFIIKSGTHTAFSGICTIKNRTLNVRFSYNQKFEGDTTLSEKKSGSYTKHMYPDYTLSFWPADKTDEEAEAEELIVHIHFDAKYKVNYSGTINQSREDEEDSERKGNYKNIDLFKMHAYKDAIRRTGGAYILYPGNSNGDIKRGFHEIIPGLGAFALRPSQNNDGITELSDFIDKIISHLINRASQRENIASKTYQITKNGKTDSLKESIPEYINGKKLIPDDTYVLVGFSKDNKRLRWYKEHGLYNFRMNDEKGSLVFNNEVINAEYLLIRESGKSEASQIFKIKQGVRVFSKEKLKALNHPEANKEHYLVIDFEKEENAIKEFENVKWNFKDLEDYQNTIKGKNFRSAAGLPFTTTLTKLMTVIKKD